MREDAFRAFLARRYPGQSGTASSVLSCARRVERVLGVDLDHLVTNAADDDLSPRLRRRGVRAKPAASCASAVRRYAEFAALASSSPSSDSDQPIGTVPTRPVERRARPTVVRRRAAVVTEASLSQLMVLYADVLAELRDRTVIRTSNVVGDFAEYLFARTFDWTLTPNSRKGVDAVGDDGVRYQIKGRRPGSGYRQLGTLRGLAQQSFDQLGAILFTADMGVNRAALIPYDLVLARARSDNGVNGARFMLTDAVWRLPGVRDVTEPLRTTWETLSP